MAKVKEDKKKKSVSKQGEQIEENLIDAEKEAVLDEKVDFSDAPQESEQDQEIDIETAEDETGTEEGMAPEVAAINTDTETALVMDKKAEKPKKKAVKKAKANRVRSKKYQGNASLVDPNKKYSIAEAIELIKKTSYSKFDGTVSLSIKLEKAKKGDDQIRGTIKLPHGTGKVQKIEIATDELIEKIKNGYSEFDILIATPAMMPKLAQVAKILGPKGKMPNPKDGTVTENPADIIGDLSENIARYRTDAGRNVHIPVGKVSWEETKLSENIQAILKNLLKFKKISITLSPTMGQSARIDAK